jgi:REP element-mobilizing transposase RayT
MFVTFRTIDSMPREVVERWLNEQREWLHVRGFPPHLAEDVLRTNSLTRAELNEFRIMRQKLWHYSLDACHGDCLLRRPELAQIVAETLLFFDGDRYHIDSLVVMPNHVHLLVQFVPPTNLKAQSTSWLRYSATKINKRLGRKGALWRPEPFDHLVRSAEHFHYFRRYIRENPEKAKLREGEFLYWCRGQGG